MNSKNKNESEINDITRNIRKVLKKVVWKNTGNKNNIYYVYHLIDPRNNTPFYIGKGKNDRMYKHEQCVNRGRVPHKNKHLYYKIKEILNEKLNVKYIKIYENLKECNAWKKEVKEEQRLKLLGIKLCNIVPCGNGGDNLSNHPNIKEIGRKISNALKGKTKGPMSIETKRKLSKIKRTNEWNKKNSIASFGKNSGSKHYMYGKSWMDWKEWRNKLKENHANFFGRKNPFYNKKHSNKTRDILSEKRRKLHKLTYDGKTIEIQGGSVLKKFIDDYNKQHKTKITVPMIRYKRNSIGWKLEKIK